MNTSIELNDNRPQAKRYPDQPHDDVHRPRIVLAEDDPAMRAMLAGVLRRDGYQVLEASSGAELLDLIASETDEGQVHMPRLVISDIRMPGGSGLDALAELRTHRPHINVVLITAFGDAATHAEAHRLDAQIVLDKPFDLDDLRTVVRLLVGPS